MRNNVFTSPSKNVGSELTTLFLTEEASSPRISCPVSCLKNSSRRTLVESSIKLLLAIRTPRYSLAANLVILSNDVSSNPGPTGPSMLSSFSSSSSFSNESSLDTFHSWITLENFNDISHYCDLGLDDKRLRIGHWNVNRLSSEKCDTMKLFFWLESSAAPKLIYFF